MRIDVRKFLFVGVKNEIELFFRKAQELGFVHFIDTSEGRLKEVPNEIEQISTAIKVLRGLPPVEQEETDRCEFADRVAEKIIAHKRHLEKLAEDQRVLKLEKSRVEIFGDFSLDDIAYIEKEGPSKVQFFCGKRGMSEELKDAPGLVYIGTDSGLDYFTSVNREHTSYDKLIEMHIDHPYGKLLEKERQIRQDIHNTEQELKSYSKYSQLLHDCLEVKLNKYNLHSAQAYSRDAMDGALFAVEGWVSESNLRKLDELVLEQNVHCEEIAIEPKDRIPTYLENTGLGKVGEDLVHVYDTPSTSDNDPSYWVLWCFAFFFAFIVGDAGYGLVFLAIAGFIYYKFPHLKGMKSRMLKLLAILGASCFIWGILTTSFFGFEIGIDNPIRKLSLTQWLSEKKLAYYIETNDKVYVNLVKEFPDLANEKDAYEFMHKAVKKTETGEVSHVLLERYSTEILFELALFIAIIHIGLSMIRNLKRSWAGYGWLIFLVGAYLYFPYYLNTPSLLNYVVGIPPQIGGEAGLELIYGGVALACFLAIAQHGLSGLHEPLTLIQIFADSLSYLRLYALALAGAIVSITIKEMAGAVPVIIAIILFVIAHFVNIVLATMSGVIHGLRLNFLEWYHYSFEGGGYNFRALKLLKHD